MIKTKILNILAVTLMLTIAFPFSSGTASAENTRVAFVDIAKVLEAAPQAIAANKRLSKEFEQRNEGLIKMRKESRQLEDKLAKDGVTMSENQLRKLERDIHDLKREIKRSQEDYREDLNIRRNEELRKIQKRVYQAIVELAEKEKYDMVLGDGVIHAAKGVDITDKVLSILGSSQNSAPPSSRNN